MLVDVTKSDGRLLGEIKKHEWTNVMLKELIEWERVSVEPKSEELYFSHSKTLSAECDTNSTSSGMLLLNYNCYYAYKWMDKVLLWNSLGKRGRECM